MLHFCHLVGCCIAQRPSLSNGWLLCVVSSRCCLLWAYASCLSFVTALGIVHHREMMTIFLIVVVHSREALAILVDHDVYHRTVEKQYSPGSGTMLHVAHVHQGARRLLAVVEPEETDGHHRQLKGRRRRRTQPGGRGGIGFDRPGSPIPIPLGGEGTCFHVYLTHCHHIGVNSHTCSHLLTLAQSYTT